MQAVDMEYKDELWSKSPSVMLPFGRHVIMLSQMP
jgi:hypothetical protein